MARAVLLTLGAGAALLVLAAFAAVRGPQADAAQSPAGPAPAPPAAAPAPEPVVAAAPAAAAATDERDPRTEPTPSKLMLPDGTMVPALNGTIGPPPLARALGGRPFSPIVGVEHSPAGIDWYVHADGTKSTTEMRWRKDLGRYDALTRVAVPTGPAPPIRVE